MMQKVRNSLKIGILSAIPNLRTEVAKRLPEFEACITDCLDQSGLTSKDIQRIGKPYEVTDGKAAKDIIGTCNVLVADPDLLIPFLYNLDHISWVQSTWNGVDALTKYVDHEKPYPPWQMARFSSFGQHMAEYVMGNIIAMERDFKRIFLDQMAHEWGRARGYRLLSNLTIGLLGVGEIGSKIGKVAKSFGMDVIGMVSKEIPVADRHPFIDQYYFSLPHLPEILQRCDYVCNSLPKTPKTDNILMNGILENCKEKRGVLINIGRGNIINEKELLLALDSGWIGGAILDVFEEEPLPQTSALWDKENVVITPHCSGQSFKEEFADAFVSNLQEYFDGSPLKNVIDWKKGY